MIKVIDRNSPQTAVLLGGWGFGPDILEHAKCSCNLVLAASQPAPNAAAIGDAIQTIGTTQNLSVIGWSMGAYLASDLAEKLHADKLIMVSARRRYDAAACEVIAAMIRRNKSAYMKKFYRECFADSETDREFYTSIFRKEIQNQLLDQQDEKFLTDGLRQLVSGQLSEDELSGKNVTFIHGQQDKIAPLEEIESFVDSLGTGKLVTFTAAGHLPFLHDEFAEHLFDD